MSLPRPVTEDELHAYVDGALDDARQGEVADLLRKDAVLAGRVAGYRRDRDCLVAALSGAAARPIPAGWAERIEAATARRRPPSIDRRTALAASVALALAGGAAVTWRWSRRDTILADAQSARDGRMAAETSASSALGDPATRDARLEAALGLPVRTPNLRRFGFQLARVDVFARAVQLGYADAQRRDLTIYIRRSDGSVRFDLLRQGANRLCIWQDDVIAAVIIAPLSAGEMMRVASSAYDDLNL